jgi:hypothetical protein
MKQCCSTTKLLCQVARQATAVPATALIHFVIVIPKGWTAVLIIIVNTADRGITRWIFWRKRSTGEAFAITVTLASKGWASG